MLQLSETRLETVSAMLDKILQSYGPKHKNNTKIASVHKVCVCIVGRYVVPH